MNGKIGIVTFQGELSCFVHALLNALDYHGRGYETALIIEGQSCARVADITQSPKAELWRTVVEAGLVKAVCKACAAQMGSLEAAQAQGLPIDASLSGHASLEPYSRQGYELILF